MATPAERASDAEREATADRLREAAGEGRLDNDELDRLVVASTNTPHRHGHDGHRGRHSHDHRDRDELHRSGGLPD